MTRLSRHVLDIGLVSPSTIIYGRNITESVRGRYILYVLVANNNNNNIVRVREIGSLLGQMQPFFGELPFAVDGVFARGVDYGLHAFAVFRLLVAVSRDHVQLADAVLRTNKQNKKKNVQTNTIVTSLLLRQCTRTSFV